MANAHYELIEQIYARFKELMGEFIACMEDEDESAPEEIFDYCQQRLVGQYTLADVLYVRALIEQYFREFEEMPILNQV